MKTVSVFDPPQCCSTGVCGPDADDTLVQFAATLEWLGTQGVTVQRHNLGHDPGEFVQNALVKSTLERDGMDSLPLILVNGEVAMKGGYLSRDDFARRLGLGSAGKSQAPTASACCSKAS